MNKNILFIVFIFITLMLFINCGDFCNSPKEELKDNIFDPASNSYGGPYPTSYKINSDSKDKIEIYDEYDGLIKSFTFNGTIVNAFLKDVNNDLKNEIILGLGVNKDNFNYQDEVGEIKCIGFDGREEYNVWTIDLSDSNPYFTQVTSKLAVRYFENKKFNFYPEELYLCTATDVFIFPSRVMLLSKEGKIVGNIWHPGGTSLLSVYSISDTIPEKIIISGYNNSIILSGRNSSYVGQLSSNNINGFVEPQDAADTKFDWYYIFYPPEVAATYLIKEDTSIVLWTNLNRGFTLTFDGEFLSMGNGTDPADTIPGLFKYDKIKNKFTDISGNYVTQ